MANSGDWKFIGDVLIYYTICAGLSITYTVWYITWMSAIAMHWTRSTVALVQVILSHLCKCYPILTTWSSDLEFLCIWKWGFLLYVRIGDVLMRSISWEVAWLCDLIYQTDTHSQSVTNIQVGQEFVPWSNVSLTNMSKIRLRFLDQSCECCLNFSVTRFESFQLPGY